MRTPLFIAACAFVLALGAATPAQEGHPLVGTWHGTWGPTPAQRNDVTLVLDYDGKAITGMMNPGPDSVRFDTITLEPSTWKVRFEATPKRLLDGPAPGGAKATPIVIDATLQDVTNRHRTLAGTLTQGAAKGDFKVSRDD